MNKKAKIDFMIYNLKKDEWTWISEIKSGEFMYNNTLVTVFESQTGVRFFQTIWGNTTCQVRRWETCMDTIEDRTKNAQHYAFMEKMSQDSVAEMIKQDKIVQKMRKDKHTFDKKQFTNKILVKNDNISMKEEIIKQIRFVIYQYHDGIIELKDLLTKIEEILNEYN